MPPLTGSEARLWRMAGACGTHLSDFGHTTDSRTDTVNHPANLYVADAAGKLVRSLPNGTPAADVMKAIPPMIE